MEHCVILLLRRYSGAFEEAVRWRACAVVAAGYCLLVHARLCSIQRILPHRMCAYMQDEARLSVKHCIEFGSCSVPYWLAGWGKLIGGSMV